MLGAKTGDTATVVKLFRVSLLALVVAAASVSFRTNTAQSDALPPNARPWTLVPWFLWLFMALVVLQSRRTSLRLPRSLLLAQFRDCLVLAIAALGVKTSFQALLQTGWRPFMLLLAETVWIAAALVIALSAVRVNRHAER